VGPVPAGEVARTEKTWAPEASFGSSRGELHGSDLFHSRRAWKALRDQPALRVHAYRLAPKTIERCDGKIALVSTL
jgi:hypothetical protein